MARTKTRSAGCTLQSHGRGWVVLFRHPQQGGKVVRKSLKTTDRTVAERYKTFLDRIIADKTLWRNPSEDTPQRVREIWFGVEEDVVVKLDGSEVRTVPQPQHQKVLDPLRQDRFGLIQSDVGKLLVYGPPDYPPEAKAQAVATSLQATRADLDTAVASIASLQADLAAAQQTNEVLRQRLNQYERRAIKAGKTGSLQVELDAYVKEFANRKMNPSHRASVIYILKRFVREAGPEQNAMDVDEAAVEKYVAQRTKEDGSPLSEQMRYKVRQWICSFLTKATHGTFDRTGVKSVKEHMISREAKQIIWLESEEAQKLVKSMYSMHGEYWGDMAAIQLGMGWRPEELSILQKRLVSETTVGLEPVADPANNHVWGKTGSRSVRFPAPTKDAVKRRMTADDSLLLFARPLKKGEAYSRLRLIEQKWQATPFDYGYRSRLKKAAKAAGIAKPIVCRILRTTFGSLMIRSKRTPYEVAKVMGDRVKTIEKHYARLLAEEINTELGTEETAGRAAPPA